MAVTVAASCNLLHSELGPPLAASVAVAAAAAGAVSTGKESTEALADVARSRELAGICCNGTDRARERRIDLGSCSSKR